MKISKLEREEAIAQLKAICPAGSTVRLILKHVSRSGMSRTIQCLAEGDKDVSYLVAKCGAGDSYVNKGYLTGVRVGGCGMDMGLALIDSLSYALYGKPIDQSIELSDGTTHGVRTGGLRYKWL